MPNHHPQRESPKCIAERKQSPHRPAALEAFSRLHVLTSPFSSAFSDFNVRPLITRCAASRKSYRYRLLKHCQSSLDVAEPQALSHR